MGCINPTNLTDEEANNPDAVAKLEMSPLYFKDPLAYAETMEGPRILKTHMPMDMLDPDMLDTCKGKLKAI